MRTHFTRYGMIVSLLTGCVGGSGAPEIDDLGSLELGARRGTPTHSFTLGGNQAWYHEDGNDYGAFHTYDALNTCGPESVHKVHVLVPWGYGTSGRRYSVVYMNDGDTSFWPGGAANKSWNVPSTLARRQTEGAEPVLVVAIRPSDREYEYTHESWAPFRASGGLPGYADYLARCVKPWIDAHYATRPEREHTVVVGSSHGGLAAFYTATRHPDAFGGAACLSPSFWAGLDFVGSSRPSARSLATSSLVAPVEARLNDTSIRPRLWIDWGLRRDGGLHNANVEALATARGREMVSLLRSRYGYRPDELFDHEDAVGGHDEDAWAHRFGLAMRALAP